MRKGFLGSLVVFGVVFGVVIGFLGEAWAFPLCMTGDRKNGQFWSTGHSNPKLVFHCKVVNGKAGRERLTTMSRAQAAKFCKGKKKFAAGTWPCS